MSAFLIAFFAVSNVYAYDNCTDGENCAACCSDACPLDEAGCNDMCNDAVFQPCYDTGQAQCASMYDPRYNDYHFCLADVVYDCGNLAEECVTECLACEQDCLEYCDATIWTGDYTIETSADVIALDGVLEITGNLYIQNTGLTGLSGLDSLTSLGGNLRIDSNTILTNLTGLENLTSLPGYLWIVDNAAERTEQSQQRGRKFKYRE